MGKTLLQPASILFIIQALPGSRCPYRTYLTDTVWMGRAFFLWHTLPSNISLSLESFDTLLHCEYCLLLHQWAKTEPSETFWTREKWLPVSTKEQLCEWNLAAVNENLLHFYQFLLVDLFVDIICFPNSSEPFQAEAAALSYWDTISLVLWTKSIYGQFLPFCHTHIHFTIPKTS